MSASCRIRVLGDFEVEVDGRRITAGEWRHRRASDLVKLLALESGHRIHRERVMAALWPDLGADAAGANLRKAVHFARRVLAAADAIESGGELVALFPGREIEVDVERFENAAKSALTSGTDVESAAALYSGDLLPGDRYADWTEPRREHARYLCLELWRAAGRWEQVLEVDRSDEEAHRALMRRHLDAGRRQAAIRQFQRLREVLRLDLGVGPDEETVSLFERALGAEAAEPPSVAEQAQALLARGLLAWNRRELDEAERIAEQVHEMALEQRLARELGEASCLLGMIAFAKGRWADRFRAEFTDALRLTPRQSGFVFDNHLCLAEAMVGGGDAASIGRLARDLLPAARAAGSTHGEALAGLLVGETSLLAGELGDAEGWLRTASGAFEGMGSGSGNVLALISLATIAERRGERRAANQALRRIQPLAEKSELAPHLSVRLFAGLISTAEGSEAQLDALDEAERALHPGPVCGPCSIGMRINAVIACATAGELPRARRCLLDAEAIAGMWQGGPYRAAAFEARAAVRRAEGGHEQAAGLLLEAAALYADSGRAVDAARCRHAAEQLGNAAGTLAF